MALSSPASDLSPDASFYSAQEGNSTTASSPVHGNLCRYRKARQLPAELKTHCSVLLEERLFSNAAGLLNSLLASGASRQSRGAKTGIHVPPPSHLALLATLTVQPWATTQAEELDHIEAASQSLDYLRNLLHIVGPLNADFRTAFQFLQRSRSRRGPGYQSHGNNSDLSDGDSDPDEDLLSGTLSNELSLWQRGQDFWAVFGWAMNCSTLYPRRWPYWKSWLEFMLDAMARDWEERERLDLEAHEADGNVGNVPVTARSESIIAMYLEQQSGRRGTFKAILKAMFADGDGVSLAFQKIFAGERKGPKSASKKRKRETLDLDKDKWGDYCDDDGLSSGTSEPPTPEKPRGQKKDASYGTSQPGLSETVRIRLRLFRVLSMAVYTLQPEDLRDLYDDFAATVKVLPLPMFCLVVSPQDNPMLDEAQITVLKELLTLLTPNRSKDPARVDPEAEAQGALSVAMLQECWAPHHANTLALDDNAKLSVVIESVLQLLWAKDQIGHSEELAEAIRKGIDAREARTKRKRLGKGKADPSEVLAQDVLKNSSERLDVLLNVIEASSTV